MVKRWKMADRNGGKVTFYRYCFAPSLNFPAREHSRFRDVIGLIFRCRISLGRPHARPFTAGPPVAEEAPATRPLVRLSPKTAPGVAFRPVLRIIHADQKKKKNDFPRCFLEIVAPNSAHPLNYNKVINYI